MVSKVVGPNVGISVSQIIEAAKSHDTIGYMPSNYLTVVFEHEPSWLYAHYIPVLRFELSDILGCELLICGGGHGCFWTAFGFGHVTEEGATRILKMIESPAVSSTKERYGIKSISLKYADQCRLVGEPVRIVRPS